MSSRLALAAFLTLIVPAFAAEPLAPPGTPASAFPKPDRPVAEIIAPLWASEAQRDKVDEVGQVARLMGIAPGQTVADIGAGSGYYTTRLAERVGPRGHVFAEDVTPRYLADLTARLARAKLGNVTVVRGEPHDPRLSPGSLDAALLVHMYHEISQPYGLLHNLAAAMKPGGRVGIVDADAIPSRHGTPPALLRCELSAAGYREIGFSVLEGGVGYLAIFEAPAPAARPDPSSITPCTDGATRTGQR
ncbi:methyltransferase domain-containing protein [Methylobacterium sp. SD274]|uniref:methyltransferase domain-containing protein n=1 Tax=Methylobacterium sp. SD274 TaxID=2782009 RepID=UPI001A96391D|nr:methyltransferase domain-containing protein [Methylobacterium sp. SD274]MBO1022528.1 methyltransferase domain-containing protein [Methylobacterium sp. SD274]